MTTVVATKKAIYADSQCTSIPSYKTTKLFHVICDEKTGGEDYIVGGCGYLTEIQIMVRLIREYGLERIWKLHLTEHWPPKILKSADSDLLVVTRDRRIYTFDRALVPCDVNQDTYCIGSGAEFATSALALGKSPKEAVFFACEHDPYSKPPVVELKFPRKKREQEEA